MSGRDLLWIHDFEKVLFFNLGWIVKKLSLREWSVHFACTSSDFRLDVQGPKNRFTLRPVTAMTSTRGLGIATWSDLSALKRHIFLC